MPANTGYDCFRDVRSSHGEPTGDPLRRVRKFTPVTAGAQLVPFGYASRRSLFGDKPPVGCVSGGLKLVAEIQLTVLNACHSRRHDAQLAAKSTQLQLPQDSIDRRDFKII